MNGLAVKYGYDDRDGPFCHMELRLEGVLLRCTKSPGHLFRHRLAEHIPLETGCRHWVEVNGQRHYCQIARGHNGYKLAEYDAVRTETAWTRIPVHEAGPWTWGDFEAVEKEGSGAHCPASTTTDEGKAIRCRKGVGHTNKHRWGDWSWS